MKLSTIVANALEICDSRIETACEYQTLSMYWRYVDRQNKIRNWYFRRIVRGVSHET